jgi:hypothetical protein
MDSGLFYGTKLNLYNLVSCVVALIIPHKIGHVPTYLEIRGASIYLFVLEFFC